MSTLFSLSPLRAGRLLVHINVERASLSMDDLLTSNGQQDAFDDFSPSMQPEFLPEMAGVGTVVWEDFDELNNPDPNPDDNYWMSVEQHKELLPLSH